MVHRKYKYLHDIEYTSIGADMRIINNLNVLFQIEFWCNIIIVFCANTSVSSRLVLYYSLFKV